MFSQRVSLHLIDENGAAAVTEKLDVRAARSRPDAQRAVAATLNVAVKAVNAPPGVKSPTTTPSTSTWNPSAPAAAASQVRL